MSPQEVVEIDLLIGVGFIGRRRHHPPAANHFIACLLRHDQAIVEPGKATARQA